MIRRSAVFLDRDGVIVEDIHLLSKKEDIRILPQVREALRDISQKGYDIFIVTNQTVVARGILSLESAWELNNEIVKNITEEYSEIEISDVYLCPHHPNADVIEFRKDCECRKPKPGMILEAVEKYNLDPLRCWMVGDRPSDIQAGKMAGCRTVLVKGGDRSSLIQSTVPYSDDLITPDYETNNLFSFSKEILGKENEC